MLLLSDTQSNVLAIVCAAAHDARPKPESQQLGRRASRPLEHPHRFAQNSAPDHQPPTRTNPRQSSTMTPTLERRTSNASSEGTPAVRRNSATKRGSVSGVGHKPDGLKFKRNESSGADDFPHATKKNMAEHLVKLEQQFTLTPQRMRM